MKKEEYARLTLQRHWRVWQRRREMQQRIHINLQDTCYFLDAFNIQIGVDVTLDAVPAAMILSLKQALLEYYTPESIDLAFTKPLADFKKQQQDIIKKHSERRSIRSRELKDLSSSVPFKLRFSESAMQDLVLRDHLADSYTPYMPKSTEPVFAKKLYETVHLMGAWFDRVSHMTTLDVVPYIFDDGLLASRTQAAYGAQAKKDNNPFMLAKYGDGPRVNVLSEYDIGNGDQNAVCLGPYHIDMVGISGKAWVRMSFELQEFTTRPFFFKSKDLGYHYVGYAGREIIRTINIGEFRLNFSHTDGQRNKHHTCIYFYPDNANHDVYTVSIANVLLISDNYKRMPQILILNFFRLVDKLCQSRDGAEQKYGQHIYAVLAELNDDSLKETLRQIGEKFTDTMELNITGVHQINFDHLAFISLFDKERDTVHIPRLVAELQQGKLAYLDNLFSKYGCIQFSLSIVFHSKRFVCYLLSKQSSSLHLPFLEYLLAKFNAQDSPYKNEQAEVMIKEIIEEILHQDTCSEAFSSSSSQDKRIQTAEQALVCRVGVSNQQLRQNLTRTAGLFEGGVGKRVDLRQQHVSSDDVESSRDSGGSVAMVPSGGASGNGG